MINLIFRIISALVLTGLVGHAFYRSQDMEHGGENRELAPGPTKHTEVLVFSDGILLLFPLITVLGIIFNGLKEGILLTGLFFSNILIIFSLYSVVLYLLIPLLRRYFSARACAILWIVPMYLYYNITLLTDSVSVPFYQIYIPSGILNILILVWAVVFVLIFGYFVVTDRIFRRRIMENSAPVTDEAVLEIWESVKNEVEYFEQTKLLRCSLVGGPFSMGTSKKSRCVVLPEKYYTELQLKLIFSHELHHLQRGDVNTKIFLNFLTALCWFNPLIWLAVRKAIEDLELSCDEIVVEKLSAPERTAYASLLLDNAMPRQGFTTCLSASAGVLRYRMGQVIKPKKVKNGTLVVVIATFICFMSYGLITITAQKGSIEELLPESIWTCDDITLEQDSTDYHYSSGFERSEAEYAEITAAVRQVIGSTTISKIDQWGIDHTLSYGDYDLYLHSADNAYTVCLSEDMLVLYAYDEEYRYKVDSALDWDALKAAL